MNIIACFKIVPEEVDITVKEDGALSFDDARLTISSFDLNSIEEAVLLAETYGGNLSALSVGAKCIDESKTKKNVLSRGPENLYLIADDALKDLDTHQTALVLKAGIEKIGEYDLVLCGEGSADLYSQQVGIQLGQLLNVPTVNSVTNISEENGRIVVERTLEDVVETIELVLPAVLTVTSDINLPRIPGMKQILAAGKKPSTVWTLADVNMPKLFNSLDVIETKAPKTANRKQDIVDGDSDDAIKEFIEKIAKELN